MEATLKVGKKTYYSDWDLSHAGLTFSDNLKLIFQDGNSKDEFTVKLSDDEAKRLYDTLKRKFENEQEQYNK